VKLLGFLRTLLCALIVLPITMLAATLVSLLLWAPAPWRIAIIRVWRRAFLAIVRVLLGISYRVVGLENLPAEAVVIMSKHQSAYETVALQEVFGPRWLSFVYKQELHMVPFIGWALASLPMISVDRGGGKEALVAVAKRGVARLGEGHHVLIFPEGTRVPPGQHLKFKSGGAHLAARAKAKVVPVAHNSGEFWPRNAFVIHPGEVVISIGPAIDTQGLKADEISRRAEEWVEAEMRRISPGAYAAAPHVAAEAS
jgi:1-acyl-sn-glycerol-3-phosphate acyltransferase